MKSTISLNMKAEHLKRLVALLVVILFCYHAIIALAEQRIAASGIGDSPGAIYMSESAEFGGSTESSLRPQVSRPNSIQEQPQQQALDDQQQALDDTRRPRYSALRYIIRDADQDEQSIEAGDDAAAAPSSYKPLLNGDQAGLNKIGELLEALGMSLPMEQMHRSGRTYLLQSQQQQQQPAFVQAAYNRYQQRPAAAARRQSASRQQALGAGQSLGGGLAPMGPGAWPQSAARAILNGAAARPSHGGAGGTRKSHANQQHHTSDTAEVAIHTPLHSRSVSEYDWKRMETSRWNNLRGMWGKRSVPMDEDAAGKQAEGGRSRTKRILADGNSPTSELHMRQAGLAAGQSSPWPPSSSSLSADHMQQQPQPQPTRDMMGASLL